MINPAAGKGQTRLQVIRIQVRHLVENLGCVETGRKKVKNVAHTNSHPTNAWTTSAVLRVNGDSAQQNSHVR